MKHWIKQGWQEDKNSKKEENMKGKIPEKNNKSINSYEEKYY